jgi:hypothetical protein
MRCSHSVAEFEPVYGTLLPSWHEVERSSKGRRLWETQTAGRSHECVCREKSLFGSCRQLINAPYITS